VQFDPQQADCRAIAQLRRIVRSRQAVELQQERVRRMNEARVTFQHAGPRTTGIIHRAVQHERQLLIERTVLVRHKVANHPTTENLHSLRNTYMSLQFFLAGMPR
jgi:hypothetical protein